ncbi:MAG: GNAT family N-acetyltransferase [Gemmatimonadota bacterium]
MLRLASLDDIPALNRLIDRSVRGLSPGYYSPMQIDNALRHVFGPDTQLIADGTYFLIESPEGLAAAGGWSKRRTLYGGDQMKNADDPLLDPLHEPARIRAFFVDPDWARRGLGRQLYTHCSRQASAAGFRQLELMATLPGVPLYRALGFEELERVVAVGDLPVVRMRRAISHKP